MALVYRVTREGHQAQAAVASRPGDHGSTFGGNPIAAAAGLAALDTLIAEGLIERLRLLAHFSIDSLRSRLRSFAKCAVEICSRGSNCTVIARVPALWRAIVQVGVLTKDTHRHTIRFASRLIIDESQVDWAADRLVEVLKEVVKANSSV